MAGAGELGGMLGDSSSSSVASAAAESSLPLAERRTLLLTMCGVVSEHTGRMCTRSLRCPQHTDVQRRGVRETFLGHEASTTGGSTLAAGDALSTSLSAGGGCDVATADKDKEIDVDTWEEGDSLASLLTAQVGTSLV